MKPFRLALTVAALPLLAVPLVALGAFFWIASLGNITSLTAAKLGLLLVAGLAQACALSYPIVFGFSVFCAVRAARAGNEPRALRISFVPLCVAGASLLLFFLWSRIGH